MKKWMRKLCGVSLALAVACSMMITLPVFAEGEEDTPTVKVSGIPTTPVLAGSTITLTISVKGIKNLDDARVDIIGDDVDSSDILSFKSDGTQTGSVTFSIYAETGTKELTASLYNVTIKEDEDGPYEDWYHLSDYNFTIDVEEKPAEISAELTNWAPISEAVVGTPYPFAITVTNITDYELTNIIIETYGLKWNKYDWEADITYSMQDNVTINGAVATILSLPVGRSITIEGTITFPANAIDEQTHLITNITYEDFTYTLNGYGARGDGDHFPVVAAASSNSQNGQENIPKDTIKQASNDKSTNTIKLNENTGAVKTGDTAPVLVFCTALLVSLAAIIAIYRKRLSE